MPYKSIIVSCTLVALIKIINATPAGYHWDADYVEIDYQEYEEPKEIKEEINDDITGKEGKKASLLMPEEKPRPKPQPKKPPRLQQQPQQLHKPPQPQPKPEKPESPQPKPQPQEEPQTESCLICLEEVIPEKILKCAHCNAKLGHPACIENMKKINTLEEEKDEDELGTVHPHAIKYQGAKNTTREESLKIQRYQKATPQSEPNWQWFSIRKHNYFLEEGTLWRYEKNNAPKDGFLHPEHWRYIKPPQCPICREPDMKYLKPFAINPKHGYTH